MVIAGNHELSFGFYDGCCDTATFERRLGSEGAKDVHKKVSVVVVILELIW